MKHIIVGSIGRCDRCIQYKESNVDVSYRPEFGKYLCKNCVIDLSIMLKATKI